MNHEKWSKKICNGGISGGTSVGGKEKSSKWSGGMITPFPTKHKWVGVPITQFHIFMGFTTHPELSGQS